ncbi:MAG: DUF4982 domain-containing protein [Defluviitaleaceae bacterium]|nr:DUF4982 domain-containing protein [Defluviitaleaceae bacterium]
MRNSQVLFNDNWQFSKNDGEWCAVSVPHDWLIYDTRNLYENSVGRYKKIFDVVKDGRLYILRFDGVYMNCAVYVNGNHAGDWKYGYTSFEFDITDLLVNGENEVMVQVVFESPNARWYTGAGIYRNVWLKTVSPTHIVSDGVYITPAHISGHKWEVAFEVEVTGDISGVEVSHEIFKPGGEFVASVTTADCNNEQRIVIEEPELWDIDTPNRYTVVTKLIRGDEVLHEESNIFGFRTIRFDTEKGFFLNDRHMKIYGVCQHHDLGCLGAAFNIVALRRQMMQLKEMGANGIRTAHNPPDPAVMHLADEMGFLVVSEILDMWERPKGKYDYARFFTDWIERDVASWVRRDRNHPSLIMWSIGNEVFDTHADPDRASEVIKMFINLVKKHDPKTNAHVTIGTNHLPWENTQKCADLIKLVGYNYGEYLYADHRVKYPDWFIYGAETGSVVQSRGIYHFPLSQSVLADDDEQCSSLGNSATSWGARSTDVCIMTDRDVPFSLGQFIWTGTDYIGEPTPYHTKNSYFGQIDTAGFYKDAFYIYQSAWTDYKLNPMIHIFPYWDFSPGQMIDVRVVSNAPKIELFFNGNSLGTFDIDHKNGKKIIGDWKLPYEPGNLKAMAYDENGKVIATDEKSSFDDAAEIVLKPNKTQIAANGTDLVFIEISAIDPNGVAVENATNRVDIAVEGAGYLIGLDNGDSSDYDQYKGTSRRLFSGKLLAVVASTFDEGDITFTVTSRGLPAKSITLKAVKADVSNGLSTTFTPNTQSKANDEIPIRKIQLTSDNGNKLDNKTATTTITAEIFPKNATHKDLIWRVTNAAGIDSNIATLEVHGSKAILTAIGDGEAYVRCSSKNGKEKISLISYFDFKAAGLGTAYLDPYGFVAGGLYNRSNAEMTNGNERGIATLRDGVSHVGFAGVDFGPIGADTITLPIFAMTQDTVPIEIWEGMPGDEGAELITTATYTSGSQWNTYKEETYTLPRRIKGITTICFVVQRKIHIKGFSFEKIHKAYEQIHATSYTNIYGDSFDITKESVCGIGNNVIIEFDGMDFTNNSPTKLQIHGRTPLDINTIQLKFDDGEPILLDFEHSGDYVLREFDILQISGKDKVSFVFLPGCNFDFGWFRFM